MPTQKKQRPQRRVTVAQRLEYVLISLLLGFFRVLGLDGASFVAGKFTRFVGPLLRSIARRGEDNLRLIFPDWSDAQIKATMGDVWENLGRTAGEYAHLDKLSVTGNHPRIQVEGVENIMPLAIDPGRAIFVTGHFANWEAAGIAADQMGLRFGFVYRALNNPLIDELITRKRAAVSKSVQIQKGIAGARPMVDALQDKISIAFLADQRLRTGGIPVPFMGHAAMTAPAAARLAIRHDLPVVPISNVRLNGARFKISVRKPIEFAASGDFSADVFALTEKINAALEKEVRAQPGQWLWLHRRWAK